MFRLIIPLLLVINPVFGQKTKKEQKTLTDNLQRHIRYLSDDRLEGRRTGTEGERLAGEYIAEHFRKNRIATLPDRSDYFQPFTIDEGKKVGQDAYITIDGKITLSYPNQFQPLPFSPEAQRMRLRYNPEINEKGHAWRLDVSDLIERNSGNPHFDVLTAVKTEINRMAGLGAAAVVVVMGAKPLADLTFNQKDRSEPVPIPAFTIDEKTRSEHLNDTVTEHDLIIDYRIVPEKRTARNVLAWIDNKAPTNIVIGAHYDHLGQGEDGNSMARSGGRAIHNGADDNASGTAAMMELARSLSVKNPGTHNYVFVAFSGEELGLYGSKFFVENPPYPIERTAYMVNLDMVGRLNDSTRTVTIGGYGTARQWSQLLSSGKNDPGFRIKYDSSGTGPSDHTSFYRKDIPVLFFFTGLHTDYHKPTDDHEKINYKGTADIVRYIGDVINRSQSYVRLDFQKTREQQTSTGTRFSVSMGIMPDYTYGGSGVRVDGVSEGRPAKSAGIRQGDIVLKLGERDVDSVESYMKALSGFKKGDKTKVTVKRGSETIVYDIAF